MLLAFLGCGRVLLQCSHACLIYLYTAECHAILLELHSDAIFGNFFGVNKVVKNGNYFK